MSKALTTPSEALVIEIAEQTDEEPTALPPLYETIDPDALDALVQRTESANVTFEYAGHEVTVAGTQRISVHEAGSTEAEEADSPLCSRRTK